MTLLLIALGFSMLYVSLQGYYGWHWNALPADGDLSTSQPGVSIIVVARNEEKMIAATLNGLLRQDYPSLLFEIILIDDHSGDQTLMIAQRLATEQMTVLSLADYPHYIHAPAYKKSAITLGVDRARFDHIVVTDADCEHPETWLSSVMKTFVNHHAVFQTSPVLLRRGDRLMEKMQEMEQLVLMLITGAGIRSGLHDMANGANMAFTKQAFKTVHGFEGNTHYASGDDMFLIEKMRASYPQQIHFAKSPEAAVYTDAKRDWAALLRQRARWAGKNKGLQSRIMERIWFFVGIYHALMIVLMALGIFSGISMWPGLIMLALKWLADYPVVRTAAIFFNRKELLRYFIPLQMMYTFYILRLGWMLLFKHEDDWKREG